MRVPTVTPVTHPAPPEGVPAAAAAVDDVEDAEGVESCKDSDMARAKASSSLRSRGCKFPVAAAGRKGGGCAARDGGAEERALRAEEELEAAEEKN